MKKLLTLLSALILTACTTAEDPTVESPLPAPQIVNDQTHEPEFPDLDNATSKIEVSVHSYNLIEDYPNKQILLIEKSDSHTKEIGKKYKTHNIFAIDPAEFHSTNLASLKAIELDHMPFQLYEDNLYFIIPERGIAYYDLYSGDYALLAGFDNEEASHIWDFYITEDIIYYIESIYCAESEACRLLLIIYQTIRRLS